MIAGDMLSVHTSLFDAISPSVVDRTQVIACTKPTLVHISHILEDIVLHNRLPALMFTGFQQSSHWAKETERYRELAEVAKQVCIFVGQPLPKDSKMNTLQVELHPRDPLLQEWFVLILADHFSALLCGKENNPNALALPEQDLLREFDTIFSFDPVVIDRVLGRLQEVLGVYRPEIVPVLQKAHETYRHYVPNLKYITSIINDMIEFEVKLNRKLSQTNEALHNLNAELQHERDFNMRLVNDSPSLMAMTTLDGTILMVNNTLQKLMGFHAEDVVGKNLEDTFVDSKDYPHLVSQKNIALQTNKVVHTEFRVRTLYGHEVTLEWFSHIMFDASGKPEYILGIGNDITARKRAAELQYEQDVLRIELEKERELSAVRSGFMATVSHEFRTPLATIQTSAELLGSNFMRYTPEQFQQKIDRIKNQIANLNMMVTDVQRIIEMDMGNIPLELSNGNLVAFLQTLIDDVLLAYEQSHTIVFEHTKWTHPLIRMDENLLRRIVINLLTNAIKFSPKGSTIHMTLGEEEGRISLTVSDTGIGIPPEDEKRLFTPFYRASNVGAIGGTGLGLRIVADSVKVYSGKMSYSTSPNGTTFTISLPFHIV
jgi:PAS domain S-box-containing protein